MSRESLILGSILLNVVLVLAWLQEHCRGGL